MIKLTRPAIFRCECGSRNHYIEVHHENIGRDVDCVSIYFKTLKDVSNELQYKKPFKNLILSLKRRIKYAYNVLIKGKIETEGEWLFMNDDNKDFNDEYTGIDELNKLSKHLSYVLKITKQNSNYRLNKSTSKVK